MHSHTRPFPVLDLHLFDEGGGNGGTAAPAGTAPAATGEKDKTGRNPLANVQYGKQTAQPQTFPTPAPSAKADPPPKTEPETLVTSDTAEAKKAEFEKLIKGEYKDLFDERVQRNIKDRFKDMEGYKAKAAQVDAMAPMLDMLASKYGVDSSDAEALAKAIQDDDSYYQEEATQKGLTVEQLKHMRKIERENAEFKRAAQEMQRKNNADRIYQQWQQESDALKKVYPTFDLQSECSSPEYGSRFLGLLKSGIDVQTAYEVVHKDEIMGGAMQYAAQTVQQKTVNDIKARGLRPSENGAGGSGAVTVVKSDPRTLTRKDREEISRRALRGERIEF